MIDDDYLLWEDDLKIMDNVVDNNTTKPKMATTSNLILIASCLWQRIVLNVRLSLSINASYSILALQAALAALKLVLPSKLELRFLIITIKLSLFIGGRDVNLYTKRALHLIERRVGISHHDSDHYLLYLIYFMSCSSSSSCSSVSNNSSNNRRLEKIILDCKNETYLWYFTILRGKKSTITMKDDKGMVDAILKLKESIQEGGLDECHRLFSKRIFLNSSPIQLKEMFFIGDREYSTVMQNLLTIYKGKVGNLNEICPFFDDDDDDDYRKNILLIRRKYDCIDEMIESLMSLKCLSDPLIVYRNIILTISMLKHSSSSITYWGNEIRALSEESLRIVCCGQLVDLRLKIIFFLLEARIKWKIDKAEAVLLMEEAWDASCSLCSDDNDNDNNKVSKFISRKIVYLLRNMGRSEKEIVVWEKRGGAPV